MGEEKLVIVPALSAINFSSLKGLMNNICLPLVHINSDKDFMWFSQLNKEVISYFKSHDVNDYLRIYFPNLKLSEDNQYIYNRDDIILMITPLKENIRTFVDIEAAVIYKGQFEC